jgi:hypothetical protein
LKNSFDTDLVKPFQPLVERIDQQITSFNGEKVHDGIQAARWCHDHNLIQQGYTILYETLLTYFVSAINEDPGDKIMRELASQASHIFNNHKPRDEWKDEARQHPDTVNKFFEIFQKKPELIKMREKLGTRRNDLNHCGLNDSPTSAQKLIDSLEGYIDEFEKFLG